MFTVPKKVAERASASLTNFQKVAESHRARNVSEADTVTQVKDVLALARDATKKVSPGNDTKPPAAAAPEAFEEANPASLDMPENDLNPTTP